MYPIIYSSYFVFEKSTKRKMRQFTTLLLLMLTLNSYATQGNSPESREDSLRVVETIQITTIKQGFDLKSEPISSSLFTQDLIEKNNINNLKDVAMLTPNMHFPDYGSRITSSIYVRGLGARIDHPVIGLNLDNVPIMNKDNFDFEMADIDRIEVLRGPQSTMYGRNTMGGVMNVYTISPFQYQGAKFGLDYSSANTFKARASYYGKSENNKFGYALSGYYTQSDGFFTNEYNGEKLDWEKMGGARAKLVWRDGNGLSIENTLSFSLVDQGGYPYKQLESDQINYNDESSFDRFNLSNGLVISKKFENTVLSSVTGFQYTDNHLTIDNDFTAYDYFTLNQITNEYTISQDFVFKSAPDPSKSYSWLVGAFGFYERTNMEAPVLFKQYGIDNLILYNANLYNPQYNYQWGDETLLLESNFTTPTFGASLYHKSTYKYNRWKFEIDLRFDYEYAVLNYNNYTKANYILTDKNDSSLQYFPSIEIDNSDKLTNSFYEVLPKISLSYSLNQRGQLYASISKGYKAGGFNTQMFSDVLQQQLMYKMGVGKQYDVADIVTYDPEYSWNYEIGSNFLWSEIGLWGSLSFFFIDCFDQQLTVFPPDMITGRMMTNAGHTQSYGAELSLGVNLASCVNIYADYGYTNAKFIDYDDGEEQYAGNYVPYSPQHTASLRADYTLNLNRSREYDLRFSAGIRGIGDIYWDETNEYYQPFYTLLDANIYFNTPKYSVGIWAKNIMNTQYDTFYFESIGNKFVQQGRPQSIGISLNVNIN